MRTATSNSKLSCCVLFVIIAFGFLSCVGERQENVFGNLEDLSLEESMIPIRQGVVGQQEFWNKFSKRFINVPAFDFKNIDGAVKYKYIAFASDGKEYSFLSDLPTDNLSEIWLNLPVGYVDLVVHALDNKGKELAEAGSRKFFKASPFKRFSNTRKIEYDKSAFQALTYLLSRDYIQKWLTEKTPDTSSYYLYCYPAKVIGAVVESMLIYSSLSQHENQEAISIAKNAADYLIEISEPKGSALEYFPPTYLGTAATAKKYKDQFMVIYPAELALNYLNLFDATGEKKYYKAAINIAETYKKLQLPNGTWFLKLWKNGNPVKENLCIPIVIIEFFNRLKEQYNVKSFEINSEAAYNWIMNNPVKTFDWSGQFEDINPKSPYQNLTEHDACSFAMMLFNKKDKDTNDIILAEELLRFAEDQFVVWEKPMPHVYSRAQRWILPCVLEQYDYYVPIDASAAKMISTYLSAYKATEEKLYFAKAIELANTMTNAQIEDTGRYPTYWEYNERRAMNEGWINCTCFDIKAMLEIDSFIKENNIHY